MPIWQIACWAAAAPEWKFVLQLLSQPLATPAVVIIYTLQAALEELGWRGYMLDRLQAMWKPLGASLVLGLCHAFWHLPLFWVAGTNQIKWGFGLDFLLFVAVVIASSIYSTWFYNANGRSTLAVIVFHTVGNLSLDVFLASALQQRVFDMLFVLGAVLVATSWTIRTPRRPPVQQGVRARNI